MLLIPRTEQSMAFSPQQALNLAQIIAQPRRVGSHGEQVVAAQITNHLTGLGYHVEQQPFQFIAALHGWIRLEIGVGSLLILTMMLYRGISTLASILLAILLISMIFLAGSLHRWVQSASILQKDCSKLPLSARFLSLLGLRSRSINILASHPDLPLENVVPHLYLIAHYDSKSQTLPLPIRMACFVFFILGGFSTAIMTILSLLFPEVGPFIPYAACGSLLFGIPLITMGVGNDSPGAIDNASGVGLVLHLAETLATNKALLQKIHVAFLFTAAEEEGLMGAQAFVTMNEPMLRSQAQMGEVVILNLDGIGTEGKLLLDGISHKRRPLQNKSLVEWLREICFELDIALGRFPPLGALMDHAPFAQRGFNAISLATSGKAAWSVHTRGDIVGKLHTAGFDRAGRVALQVVHRLAYGENTKSF
jgi:hypothetical protein